MSGMYYILAAILLLRRARSKFQSEEARAVIDEVIARLFALLGNH